jgi:hypothetical protein
MAVRVGAGAVMGAGRDAVMGVGLVVVVGVAKVVGGGGAMVAERAVVAWRPLHSTTHRKQHT